MKIHLAILLSIGLIACGSDDDHVNSAMLDDPGIDLAGTSDFDNAAATGVPAAITPIDPPTQHSNELPLDLTVVDWLNE